MAEITAGQTDRTRRFDLLLKIAPIVLICLGCLVGLLLAELGARIFFPNWCPTNAERATIWTYDPLLGWKHKAGQQERFSQMAFSVQVSINSHGQRDSEYPLERGNKNRMLVLGDSFGWGFGVEHEERFSELIEMKHTDWEVVNASVSGYGTDQEYLYLKEQGVAFKPDVVLLLFYRNDFVNNTKGIQYWYAKPFFTLREDSLFLQNNPVPKSTLKMKAKRFLAGRTYLGWRIRVLWWRVLAAYKNLRQSNQISRPGGDRNASPGIRQIEDERWDVTGHLIRAINTFCTVNGSRFVLVSVPMCDEGVTFLRQIADAEGIPYLPLDEAFGQAEAELIFPGDIHWNAKGHKIVAEAIEAFLLREGMF